jgi:hypothetical protein
VPAANSARAELQFGNPIVNAAGRTGRCPRRLKRSGIGESGGVLFQRDKLNEAFVTISTALQRDPDDRMNQALFERIVVTRDQSRSEARVPWYRKLWRQ